MAPDENSPVGRAVEMAVAYMSKPGNARGGHLAHVLDPLSGLSDPATIRECREDAEDADDADGVALADTLLALHGVGFVDRVRKYAVVARRDRGGSE